MANKNYTPKISFNVTEDVFQKWMNIDWGIRGRLMNELMRQLFMAVDTHGLQVVYLIIAKKLTLFGLTEEKTHG